MTTRVFKVTLQVAAKADLCERCGHNRGERQFITQLIELDLSTMAGANESLLGEVALAKARDGLSSLGFMTITGHAEEQHYS